MQPRRIYEHVHPVWTVRGLDGRWEEVSGREVDGGDIERGADFFLFYSPFSRTASRLRSDSEKSARVRARIEYEHTCARAKRPTGPVRPVYSGTFRARVPGTVRCIQYVRGTWLWFGGG